METFFNTEKYDKLYNCSYYSEDLILEAQKKHVLFGLGMVAFYCVCMFLYVPCLLAIAFSSLIRRSSYQLMMFLGINHICGLSACALSAGLLSIFGVEFCQRPTIVYFVGTLGLLSWCGSTMTSFVLGVNRCCELDSSVTAERFFGGNRKYFWLVVLTLYAISPTIYTMPPIYDPIMMSAFFNPHHAYFNDDGAIYYNLFHLANNVFVCVAHTGVYIVFISLYLKRVRAAQKKVIRDRNTYIQIISIGLIHFIASILYVVQQFIPVTFYSTLLASTFYMLSQGVAPFIYLIYNNSIRNTVKAMFCGAHTEHSKVSMVHKTRSSNANTSELH